MATNKPMDEIEFVDRLAWHFRENKQESGAGMDFLPKIKGDYVAALSERCYSANVLETAFRQIIQKHETPWFPTLAECMRYCREAFDGEEYLKQQSRDTKSDEPGIERLSTGIATTKAFTRKIHRACGKEAFRFIDVWKHVKAKCQHLPNDRLESGLLYAARLLCQGRAAHDAARCAFPEALMH